VSGGIYIQAVNGIKIGKNFLFAPGIKIISSNHDFIHRKAIETKPIIIGSDVWLGANVVILPGVKLADGAIVGAGSIVTKSFTEKNSVIVGNPAKLLKVY
jgi:acetyltransferase-like isoleucine patch superfamily enzyme